MKQKMQLFLQVRYSLIRPFSKVSPKSSYWFSISNSHSSPFFFPYGHKNGFTVYVILIIEDVFQFMSVDGKNFISRFQFQFFCNRTGIYSFNNMSSFASFLFYLSAAIFYIITRLSLFVKEAFFVFFSEIMQRLLTHSVIQWYKKM